MVACLFTVDADADGRSASLLIDVVLGSWLCSKVTQLALAIHGLPPRLKISRPERSHARGGRAAPDLSSGATFRKPVGILGGARMLWAVPPRAEGMAGYRMVPRGRSLDPPPPPPDRVGASSSTTALRPAEEAVGTMSTDPAREEEAAAALPCPARGDSERLPEAASLASASRESDDFGRAKLEGVVWATLVGADSPGCLYTGFWSLKAHKTINDELEMQYGHTICTTHILRPFRQPLPGPVAPRALRLFRRLAAGSASISSSVRLLE